MTHLWVRAESRANEQRVGLTPQGAKRLLSAGMKVTVEDSPTRCIPTADYKAAGCDIAAAGTWPSAPKDAVVFGLKELPEDRSGLSHRHILFGHAYKGQPSGKVLLKRFAQGQGTLLDLEYLIDETGKRVAAFGYWAGYTGAAVTLKTWIAQQNGTTTAALTPYASTTHMLADLQTELITLGKHRPTAIIIGALGRVGTGAADLCREMGVACTKWDMDETAKGAPFPEILQHDLFLNCILARPGTPVFVPNSALVAPRKLSVIGDIACDPDSDFSPIKVYNSVTTWDNPALRVHDRPPLDVMAIDNLPSLLPLESSEDFADQLLPYLQDLPNSEQNVWTRATSTYEAAISAL